MNISAVLTPCSARKQKLPVRALDASRLIRGGQSEVGARWLAELEAVDRLTPSRDLYQGASFLRSRRVADTYGCPLFVVSAGLGLLAADTRVPAYDLTLSQSSLTRIQTRVIDHFDSGEWWRQIQLGPFATPLNEIAKGQGRILVALTKPYAKLIGAALTQLPATALQRLRIFGASLEKALPAALHEQVLPYDDRLSVLIPGTRLDFSSRALAHFAALAASQPLQCIEADAQLVLASLAPASEPQLTRRSRASDLEVLKHAQVLAQRGLPSARALRELRNGMGVACEQGRFKRLYKSIGA